MNGILNGWKKRYELVELVIPANSSGTRFPYPDIPQLRDDTTQDIVIMGLETFSIDAMPLSPNGNTVATMAYLLNSFLTLYIEGEESMRQVPLVRLQPVWQSNTAGNLQGLLKELAAENLRIDWNKSYIQAAAPYGGGANAQFSIMLGVWYKKLQPGEWEKISANIPIGW
jgi:hypothetical protein